MNGIETSRTEPTKLSSIGYDDGSDFTENDYNNLTNEEPMKKKGFFSRLFD